MKPPNIEDVYPLSPLQEGLLFHALLAPDSPAYFDQYHLHLSGDLEVRTFADAWRRIVDRYAILRTAFMWRSGRRPMQVVAGAVPAPLEIHDWSLDPDARDANRLERFLAEDRRRPFDLARPPLCRFSLIRVAEREHVFVWSRHHLLLDGWSVALVLRDAIEIYAAMRGGREPERRATPPYRAFIEWLQRQDEVSARRFWTTVLEGVEAATPVGAIRTANQSPAAYVEVIDRLDGVESARLTAFARANGLTVNTVLQGAFALLLARFSGESDVVFGATVSGRPTDLPDVDAMVGLLINTLPVRARLKADMLSTGWLRDLQRQQFDARRFDYASLVQIHGWSAVPRQQPLFEGVLVFENYPVNAVAHGSLAGLEVVGGRAFERTHYPLTLIVAADAMSFTWIADDAHLPGASLRRWIDAFRTLLRHLIADGSRPIGAISCLSDTERTMLVRDWNRTALPFDESATLDALVERQAALTPDAAAIVHGEDRVTYAELNARSDRIADRLVALGVSVETPVGICTHRTPNLVAGLLGILKVGATYVPLDVDYPAERLAFMLGDSGARTLVSERSVVDRLPAQVNAVLLDDLAPGSAATLSPTSPGTGPTRRRVRSGDAHGGDNLAYVIYTSGSTGRPKAAAIRHRSAVALLAWARTVFGDDELSGMLASTSICFDLSVFEIFLPLTTGGSIILADNALALPALPAASLVTFINTVPSAIAELTRQNAIPASVRTVALAGEPLTAALADRLYAQPGIARVFDLYGPSEATTYSTWTERIPGGPATIGRPIANTELYIVDSCLEPALPGVVGDLLLGGAGLARGYLGRPDLTADRFVPDPFSGRPGARLYRTGDRARFRADGHVEFLGRSDHQIKLRGFRIEPGEIQAALESHPAVGEVAVVARPNRGGESMLVFYVAPRTVTTAEALRRHLATRLPAYMTTGIFCFVDALPRTPNGKLDRSHLPDPFALEAPPSGVGPQTIREELLLAIWRDVLARDTVGVDDDFFEIGGHSLLATRIISRVARVFRTECPLRLLFDHPTVGSFAPALAALATGDAAAIGEIEPREPDDDVPLSFVQQRLWFLQQFEPDSAAYNIPLAVQVDGPLDAAALETALAAVVARHEVLRGAIDSIDGRPHLRIEPAAACDFESHDLHDVAEDDRRSRVAWLLDREAQKPFDLRRAPLIRAMLIRLSPSQHVFAATLHHLVGDEWSLDLLVGDLAVAYEAAVAGRAPGWRILPIQYGDVAAWQRRRANHSDVVRQLGYWRSQLAGFVPLDLPTDRPRTTQQTVRGVTVQVAMPDGLVEAVRRFATRESGTPFLVLLAAFNILLARYASRTDIVVGTPVTGRRLAEVEPLIGCFLNTLLVRTHLHRASTFRRLVSETRDTMLAAHAHQDVPFEQIVDELQPERDVTRPPLAPVMFVFERARPIGQAISGLRLAPLPTDTRTAKFDLSFIVRESGDAMTVAAQVNADLFDRSTASRMLDHYLTLLAGALAEPDVDVAVLRLLPGDEREPLVDWNRTTVAFPPAANLVELIDRQVGRTPDLIAIVDGASTITYRELQSQSHRLAGRLSRRGAAPGRVVSVCLPQSIGRAIALLSTLRTGAAALPFEPDNHQTAGFQGQPGPDLIVTTRALVEQLPQDGATILLVPEEEATTAVDDLATVASHARPRVTSEAEAVACVVQTAGQTSSPRAVAVTHGALVNQLQWLTRAYEIGPDDVVLQATPCSAPTAVLELFAPLVVGARVVLGGSTNPDDGLALLNTIRRHGVTTLLVAPSLLARLATRRQLRDCGTLARIFSHGEPLTAALRDRVFEQTRARLINVYGTTETGPALAHECSRDERPPIVPIGQPIANMTAFVLDDRDQPVPLGAAGRLHLGGAGLANGYWHDAARTADAFVPHPFDVRLGTRLYRTDDLTRLRPDGVLEWLGRADNSPPELRGKLPAIEATFSAHPAVAHAIATVQEDGRLVSHIVLTDSAAATASSLRSWAAARLAPSLVPAAVALMDTLPRTSSGTVHRRALPQVLPVENVAGHVSPRTPVERELATIWEGVLGAGPVGVTANFFGLGGDSILAIQVVSRARLAGLSLTPKMLFEHQTIEALAAVAGSAGHGRPAASDDPYRAADGLTPAQHWFFELALVDPHHFNQAVLLETPADFDIGRADRALQELARHHASLRTTFVERDGGHAAVLGRTSTATVRRIAWPGADAATIQRELAIEQRSVNFQQGSVLRLAWFDAGREMPGRLSIVAHHLAIDAVSWRILLDDLDARYTDAVQPLPAATAPPSAWVAAITARLDDAAWDEDVAFWSNLASVAMRLPGDFRAGGGSTTVSSEREIAIDLTPGETTRLVDEVTVAYQSRVDEVILAAVWRALTRWTGRREIWIDMEGHGREDLPGAPDVSRSIGWFTNLHPVRLAHWREDTPERWLIETREQLRTIPKRGAGFGVLRYLGRDRALRERLAALPPRDVVFNYLGRFTRMLGGSGIAPAPERIGGMRSPNGRRPYSLDLNAGIVDERLTLHFTYSSAVHRESTIATVAAEVADTLRSFLVLGHVEDTLHSPTVDFSDAGLSRDELNRLLSKFATH